MSDIVAFLTARLDEDEATANYSGPARIAWLTYRDDFGQMLYTTVATGGDPWVADGHELPEPASARIVYDPARGLRGVAAKRRVLERHQNLTTAIEGIPHIRRCDGCGDANYPTLVDDCPELHDLASVYADHPDYDEGWRP